MCKRTVSIITDLHTLGVIHKAYFSIGLGVMHLICVKLQLEWI